MKKALILLTYLGFVLVATATTLPKYEYDEAGNRTKLNDNNIDCFDFCLCPEDKDDWLTLSIGS